MTGRNPELDDFDPPPGDDAGFNEPPQGKLSGNLGNAWRSSPIFKIMLVIFAGGVLLFTAMSFLGGSDKPPSQMGVGSNVTDAPGGELTPAFAQAVRTADQQRAEEAKQLGESALPTPMAAQRTGLDFNNNVPEAPADPMAEFRLETERLRAEQAAQQRNQQQQQQMQLQQQQAQQDQNALAQSMAAQMQQLIRAWEPTDTKIQTVTANGNPSGILPREEVLADGTNVAAGTTGADGKSALANVTQKVVVPAGTVSYAQLLTEANSDVPGPIMAQIMAGPFKGARAIGAFEVSNKQLILRFTNINYRGVDYPVNTLALDNDTTLGGLVTEYDGRYFSRVVIPAAAAFVEGFGTTYADRASETTVVGNSVIESKEKASTREAIGEGLGEAARTVSDIVNEEARSIKPLVRVAVGTPFGMFFLASVEQKSEGTQVQIVRPLSGQGTGSASGPLSRGAPAPLNPEFTGATRFDNLAQ